jgi:hypothetical protein
MRSPMHRLRLELAARCAVVLGLAACTPYDPSLPGTPFLCASEEPRCPDGYTCVPDTMGRLVCTDHPLDAGTLPGDAATATQAPAMTR